ncbi:MAG: TlpA family protein disulfide reductase [Phycisphaerales bacterium]|nr:TlpA family protein disulfide reductase [Phycisphaerales bacterium]
MAFGRLIFAAAIHGILACAPLAHGQTGAPVPPGTPDTVPNVVPGTPPSVSIARNLPRLLVGDAAPELSVASWVRGAPVTKFEMGRVYVVEFWATWCSPCRRSIPYLSELQEKYQGTVTIVGVTSHEPQGLAHVEKFVRQSEDKFDYAVAWDDSGRSDSAWMESAGQEGIPTAFVVDRAGRIAWIGFPHDGLDAVLQQVVAGKFDLVAAAARAKREAEARARAAPLRARLDDQLAETRFTEAVATIDRIIAIDPPVMSEYILWKFTLLASGVRDLDAAYKHAQASIDGPLKDDPRALALLAWIITEDRSIERRDLAIAERATARAVEASGGKSSAALAAHARVRFAQQNIAEAVALQARAVEFESSKTIRAEYQARLDEYRAAAGSGPKPGPRK